MGQSESSDRAARLVATASRLRIDAATAEVLRSFERGGVDALLLKGPSVTRWLYPDDPSRGYLDCDLLIAPSEIDRAEDLLDSLGYRRHFDDRQMPAWWREHAGDWVRERDQVTIDLHRRLPGVGADPEFAWRRLSAQTDRVPVADYLAPTLARPALALHVALHAAHHGARHVQPMRDLQLALESADDELWSKASALARDLDATDAFSIGLRLASRGSVIADRLGLPRPRSIDVQLRATSPPPGALAIEQVVRARGFRGKAVILGRKVFPPAEFVKHWDPRASESPLSLARAYLRRPAWLLRRAPKAVIAWQAARYRVRGSRNVRSGAHGSGKHPDSRGSGKRPDSRGSGEV